MKEQTKKVLILIPTLAAGGAERVLSELSLWASKHVDLVCVVFEEQIAYPFEGRIVSLNVSLRKAVFVRPLLFFLRWWRLRKLLAKENPDSLISFGYSADLLNIFCNKRAVIRVDMFLSEGRRGTFGGFTRLIAKTLFRHAELVLAVSRAIKDDLVKAFGIPEQKIRVIPNPIDVKRIQRLSQEPLPLEYEDIFRNPVAITMGRLTKQKGQWHLLKAFAHATRQAPAVQLVLLGEGPLKSALIHVARQLGIADSVHFVGWQENPYRFLQRSQVFVLSSLWEGLPMVLLEAMACGLPVVSTNCKSGPQEILASHAGILTPVCARDWDDMGKEISQEEQQLAEAILKVLGNKEYAAELSVKSLTRAQDFDNSKVFSQYDFLWNEMFYEPRL